MIAILYQYFVASIYVERFFSKMKYIKSHCRLALTIEHLYWMVIEGTLYLNPIKKSPLKKNSILPIITYVLPKYSQLLWFYFEFHQLKMFANVFSHVIDFCFSLQNVKYILSGPLQKEFANLSLR